MEKVEVGWVRHSFYGHSFSLPGEYVQVTGCGDADSFPEGKLMEFEAKSARASSAAPLRDEWGLDTSFEDKNLIHHLSKRFPELHFCFLDGRLCVSYAARWLHGLESSVALQFFFFAQRTGQCGGLTFPGPKSLFRKSGVRQSMSPDVTVVRQEEVRKAKGGSIPLDVQDMICFQVATSDENEQSVHAKCEKMISLMNVRFVVGLFPRSGLVRTYFAGRRYTEQFNPASVDMGEAIPCLRFYLTPLCRFDGAAVTLWPFPPPCKCKLNWSAMYFKNCEDAVCDLISQHQNECAAEGVNFLGNVNFRDAKGRTPMVIAASVDNAVMLDFLHSQGARLDFTDEFGVSPLLAAWNSLTAKSWFSSVGMEYSPPTVEDVLSSITCTSRLKLLLAAGAPVTGYVSGLTLLGHAIRKDSLEAVKLLVNAGAPTDTIDAAGTSPFMLAILTYNPEMMAFFAKRANHRFTQKEKDVAQLFNFGHVVN